MHVLLLNLPWSEKGCLGVRAGSRWPFKSLPNVHGELDYIPFPFFLAYATSFLKKNGKTAQLIDAIAEGINIEELKKRMHSFSPDVVVIEISTPSSVYDFRMIENIRKDFCNCKIVVCGPHATVFPKQILEQQPAIDYILMGEYEYILFDLVLRLETKSHLNDLLGVAYRYKKEITINAMRMSVSNLDDFPWPEREDVPIYRYRDGFAGLPSPQVQILASRGCLYQCTFCMWPQTMYKEHRHRKRDYVDVVAEMKYLIETYHFKAVYFDDDLFNADKMYISNICAEIKRKGIRVPWAIMGRADIMDEKILTILADAGLYAIKYGIESVDEKVLSSCKKKMNIDRVRQMILMTRKLGVKVHLTFCLGLPGETKDTFQKTIQFIEEVVPDSLQFSFAIPFPGTEYFEYADKNKLVISKDWSDYDGNQECVIRTHDLNREELVRMKDFLHDKFDEAWFFANQRRN